MLRGLAPVLSGPLLAALDSLGHGDGVAVVDANFPRRACPELTVLVGTDAVAVLTALARHVPLEGDLTVMEHPVSAHTGVQELVDLVGLAASAVPREAFYTATASATLVIRTRDTRPFGDLLMTVGALDAEEVA